MRCLFRHRRTLRLIAAGMLIASQLLLLATPIASATTAQQPPAALTFKPGDPLPKYYPGLEFVAEWGKAGLAPFYPEPGTYQISPAAAAAAIQEDAYKDRGWKPEHRIVKVFSTKLIEDGMYAVRYKTNQNFGIVRGVQYCDVVVQGPDGSLSAGGMFFIDPLWAIEIPDIDPTWRTAVGGMAAVAAAAAALAAAAGGGAAAGAAAAGAAGSGSGRPGRGTIVGHILQLGARRLDVTLDKPALLEASVWRVHGDGSYEPANDCQIMIALPEGFVADATEAVQSLTTTIRQTPKAPAKGAIAVMVNGPASGTTDYVELVGEVPPRITWRVEPANRGPLVPNGRDKLTLVAVAEPPPSLLAAGLTRAAASQNIRFTALGEWCEVSEPVTWSDGGRAVTVIARTPDPTRRVSTPADVRVQLDARIGETDVTEVAVIGCGGLPELVATPAELEVAEGCRKAFDVLVVVNNHAGAEWKLTAEWKEGDQPLGKIQLIEPKKDRVTLRITEEPPKAPNPSDPVTVSHILVTATAEDFDDVELEFTVKSMREGLFADPVNRFPDGSFHVAADGSKKETLIGFRVYQADPLTGVIKPNPALARSLRFEPNEDPGTPARNLLDFAKLDPVYVEMRDTGSGPTAVYRFVTERTIPGRTPRSEVAIWVSVNGQDREKFGYDLRIGLMTPATAPGSPQWNIEYERCKKIINEFCPAKYRDKLMDTLENHGKQLGAEGLAEMRKRIWFISADLVLAEGAEGYQEEAAWADRIVTVLDWAQYAGDIAFGIVLSTYAGPYTAFAAQMLKPMMISAIIAYREGRSPEEWLHEQLYTVVAICEGKLIDPDNFAKLTGGNKAKAWALYVSYHFFKEYFYNKKSFVEAIKSVGMNVAEEVLVGWLSEKVRASGIPADATKPGDATIRPSDPVKPVDPLKPADGARPPAGGTRPTDASRPPADGARPAEAGDGSRPAQAAGTGVDATGRKPKPGDSDWDPAADAEAWVRGAGGEVAPKPVEGGEAVEGGRAKTEDRKGPPDPHKKAPPKPKRPEIGKTAQDVREHSYRGPDGRRYCDIDKTLEIMRDPTKTRELKNAPPDVQEAFENTRRAIYERHDATVVDAARRSLPGGHGMTIKVLEFRTPGQGGSGFNTDRDFRVCYESTDPNTGQKVWIEVPRKNWEAASHQRFAELTGGPRPADPANPTKSELEAMQHWAESHNQLATDKSHAEASLDFTDQGWTIDPKTGDPVRTQVTPNIELVKQGKSTLHDADGLGHMFEQKVRDAADRSHHAEAFAQAKKGVEQLSAVREGYAKQGYDVGQVNPKMQAAMDAVAKAGKDSTNPDAIAAADKAIKDAGFRDLGDLMSKVHGQFASLGMARKR